MTIQKSETTKTLSGSAKGILERREGSPSPRAGPRHQGLHTALGHAASRTLLRESSGPLWCYSVPTTPPTRALGRSPVLRREETSTPLISPPFRRDETTSITPMPAGLSVPSCASPPVAHRLCYPYPQCHPAKPQPVQQPVQQPLQQSLQQPIPQVVRRSVFVQPAMPTLLQSKPVAVGPFRVLHCKVIPPSSKEGLSTQPAPEAPDKEPEPEKDPAEVQAGTSDFRILKSYSWRVMESSRRWSQAPSCQDIRPFVGEVARRWMTPPWKSKLQLGQGSSA